MAKRKTEDWEATKDARNTGADNGDWETTSSGQFAPMWKPETEGSAIIITPGTFHMIEMKQGKKKKTNVSMECMMMEANDTDFYQGKGKEPVAVAKGDIVTIPLSYNLLGEKCLAVQEDEDNPESMRLSALSKLIIEDGKSLKLIFTGKVPIGGGRSVKGFIVQAPKGYREKIQAAVLAEAKANEKRK